MVAEPSRQGIITTVREFGSPIYTMLKLTYRSKLRIRVATGIVFAVSTGIGISDEGWFAIIVGASAGAGAIFAFWTGGRILVVCWRNLLSWGGSEMFPQAEQFLVSLMDTRELAGKPTIPRNSLRETLIGMLIGTVIGLGVPLRALVVRFFSTLWFSFKGISYISPNWWNDCFVKDFRTTPEILPTLPDKRACHAPSFAMQNAKRADTLRSGIKALYGTLCVIQFFPAYFYRLYIKSTFWFYWPLVFLFRPISPFQKDTSKTQILHPISNIGILLFNLVPIIWLIYFVGTQVGLINTWEAVPVYAQYLLVLNWGQLEYWDWVHISVAVFTFAMVILSCGIQPYYKDGYAYHEFHKLALPLTIGLRRARDMSVRVGLVLAFGSVFINLANEAAMIVWFPEFLELRIQDTFTALRSFYNIQPLAMTPQ